MKPVIQLLKVVTICVIHFCIFIHILYGQNNVARVSDKDIAIAYITEVVNKKKLNSIPEIFSPQYTFHGMDGIERHTIQDSSLVSFLSYLFQAFPDLHYSIENAVAENSIVALNLTGTATHEGEFLGYPASNKKILFKEMFFFRILDKRIVEGWGVVDLDGVKTQLLKP